MRFLHLHLKKMFSLISNKQATKNRPHDTCGRFCFVKRRGDEYTIIAMGMQCSFTHDKRRCFCTFRAMKACLLVSIYLIFYENNINTNERLNQSASGKVGDAFLNGQRNRIFPLLRECLTGDKQRSVLRDL